MKKEKVQIYQSMKVCPCCLDNFMTCLVRSNTRHYSCDGEGCTYYLVCDADNKFLRENPFGGVAGKCGNCGGVR